MNARQLFSAGAGPAAARALLAGSLVLGGLLRWQAAGGPVGVREFWDGDWDYYALGVEQGRSGVYRVFPEWPPTAYRLPLYPAFIAEARRLRPGPRAARRFQALIDTASIGAVFLLGCAAGGPLAGGVAAAGYALSGTAVEQVPALMLEALLGFLILTAALAAVAWRERPSSAARAAAAGACVGAALSCRSTLFAFPPLLAGWFLWSFGWRKTWRALLVFALLCYAPAIPWTIRNARIFHAFIPFENGAGAPGFWEASLGMLKVRALPEVIALNSYGDLIARFAGMGELGRRGELWRLAAANVLRRPGAYALGCLLRLPALWSEQVPWILAALGLAVLPRRGGAVAVVLLLAAYFNIHAFMSVLPRFARPALGLWCALGAAGLTGAAARLAGRPSPEGRLPRASGWFVAFALLLAGLLWARSSAALAVEGSRIALEARGGRKDCAGPPLLRESMREMNARGVREAAQGAYRMAEQSFSSVLEGAPCYEESLVSRAVAREQQGRISFADGDYGAATLLVETGRTRWSSEDIESLRGF